MATDKKLEADIFAIVGQSTKVKVSFRKQPVLVRPLTIMQCLAISMRPGFGKLKGLLFGSAVGESPLDMLMSCGEAAVAAILVMAMGFGSHPKRDKLEAQIAMVPDADKIAMLNKILKMTMPRGFEDFLSHLEGLADAVGIQASKRPAKAVAAARKAEVEFFEEKEAA